MIKTAAVTLTAKTRRNELPAIGSRSFAIMYVLAIALLREHFEQLIGLGDKDGIAFLRNCGIKFDQLIRLPEIPDGYEFIWAAGKLFSYRELAKMGQPFLHVDLDALWFRKPPNNILEADVVAQNEEAFGEGVISPYQLWYSVGHYKNIPARSAELDYGLAQKTLRPMNMGTFGGKNISLISRFAEDAISTMLNPDNLKALKTIDGKCSIFLEQFLIWAHCQFHGVKPTTVINWSRGSAGDQLFDSELQWASLGYCHLFGEWKSRKSVQRFIRRYLRSNYPEQYFQVIAQTKKWSAAPPLNGGTKLWRGRTLWPVDHFNKKRREFLIANNLLKR